MFARVSDMRNLFALSLVLHLLFRSTFAQNSDSSSSRTAAPTTATSIIPLTPEMSASAVSSFYSALATASPQQPGDPTAGDAASSAGGSGGDSAAGASGSDSGSFQLSRGAVIAIVVIASSVCLFGIISAILFYLAKKRDWKIRESIRKSARKVVAALTPRRSTFPKDVHKSRSSRGLTKIDEVSNTPKRSKIVDVEKANPKLMQFEMSEPPMQSKSGRKFGRG